MIDRTVALLQNLSQFVCSDGSWKKKGKASKVEDLSLDLIGFACEAWVFSFFDKVHYPLLPIFALNISQYIDAHVNGHRASNKKDVDWYIKSFLNKDPYERDQCRLSFLNDREFKKRFTQRMGEILVNFKVPKDSRVRGKKCYGTADYDLTDILVHVTRCYLSEDFYDYYNEIFVEDGTKNEFDLFSEFLIPGGVFYTKEKRDYSIPLMRGALPGKWITGITVPDIDGQFVPIPEWLR